MTARSPAEKLGRFLGRWAMEMAIPNSPSGSVSFEWMLGERFLIERWEVDHPDAPDGLAIIGPNDDGDGFVQHYFDSRGVARVYQMSVADRVWKLWRDEADFSPLDFRQRFTGTFSDDGETISGPWEICHDGFTWEHDFELTYRKVT